MDYLFGTIEESGVKAPVLAYIIQCSNQLRFAHMDIIHI